MHPKFALPTDGGFLQEAHLVVLTLLTKSGELESLPGMFAPEFRKLSPRKSRDSIVYTPHVPRLVQRRFPSLQLGVHGRRLFFQRRPCTFSSFFQTPPWDGETVTVFPVKR